MNFDQGEFHPRNSCRGELGKERIPPTELGFSKERILIDSGYLTIGFRI